MEEEGASLNFSANAVPQLLETKKAVSAARCRCRAGTTCVSSIAALFPYSWKGLSLAIENNQKVWKSLEGDLRWGHNHLAADFFYIQASVKVLALREYHAGYQMF